MGKTNLKEAIEQIVDEETKPLRAVPNADYRSLMGFGVLARTSVSRAAYITARETRTKTVSEIAGLLGVGIAGPLDSALPGRVFEEKIDASRRKYYGYGDLPDALIRTVERSIDRLTPEHSSLNTSTRRFAAVAMNAVSHNPSVLLHDIWSSIATNEELLAILPANMQPTDVIALDGVVKAAQFHAAEYFTANPEQGE